MKKIPMSKQILQQLRICVVKCYIYLVFCYGVEARTMNKLTGKKKIEALEIWIHRRMGCIEGAEKKMERSARSAGTEKRNIERHKNKTTEVRYSGMSRGLIPYWRLYLRTRSKQKEQKGNNDIDGWTPSRDGQEPAWLSALWRQEAEQTVSYCSKPSVGRWYEMMMMYNKVIDNWCSIITIHSFWSGG